MKNLTPFLLVFLLFSACADPEMAVPTESNSDALLFDKGSQSYTAIMANNDDNKGPTVTTTSVFVGSAIYANAHGNITNSGGGSSIVDRGFCYNTITGPTILNDTAQAGSGAGDFQRLLEGLSPGTTYYFRTYAIKSNGNIYYGNELSFTTLTLGLPGPGVGTVTDIDGNIYTTITLGTQVWMVENLKTTHYRDGTPILNITDNTEWATSTTAGYCDYNNNPVHATEYGRLYNLPAIKDTRNIAPTGWHIPSLSEWSTVLFYLGGGGIAAGRMKETGFSHWSSPNTAADNSSGFTAVGAGQRAFSTSGAFYGLLTRASFWSSTSNYSPSGSTTINAFFLDYNSSSYSMTLGGTGGPAGFGFSVRCIKD